MNKEMKNQPETMRTLLQNTIFNLCKNGLSFDKRLKIQGLMAISVDSEVFVVQMDEKFYYSSDGRLLKNNGEPTDSSMINFADDPVETTEHYHNYIADQINIKPIESSLSSSSSLSSAPSLSPNKNPPEMIELDFQKPLPMVVPSPFAADIINDDDNNDDNNNKNLADDKIVINDDIIINEIDNINDNIDLIEDNNNDNNDNNNNSSLNNNIINDDVNDNDINNFINNNLVNENNCLNSHDLINNNNNDKSHNNMHINNNIHNNNKNPQTKKIHQIVPSTFPINTSSFNNNNPNNFNTNDNDNEIFNNYNNYNNIESSCFNDNNNNNNIHFPFDDVKVVNMKFEEESRITRDIQNPFPKHPQSTPSDLNFANSSLPLYNYTHDDPMHFSKNSSFGSQKQMMGKKDIFTYNEEGERVKAFECQYAGCSKAFFRKDHLTRHQRIKHGKPYGAASQNIYKCCFKTFYKRNSLLKHRHDYHGDQDLDSSVVLVVSDSNQSPN